MYTPPWTQYTTDRRLEGLSFRQLHALAEAVDCDLRGFAPDRESMVMWIMVTDRIQELRSGRRRQHQCSCWICVEPFPDAEWPDEGA